MVPALAQQVRYYQGPMRLRRPASGSCSGTTGKVLPLTSDHGRMLKTEEKTKVVAEAWEAELIQFLAALAALH